MRPKLFLLATAFLLACSPKAPRPVTLPTSTYFPPRQGDAWETISPADLGWDVAKLNETIDYVGASNSDAFLILYKGRLVTERYWNGFNATSAKRIFSVTKSMAGFMVGLAQQQGKLDITRPVSEYLGAGWSKATLAQESQITVRHLLTMTSGLKEDLTYEAAPGTKWYYNTPAYYRTFDVLARVYGQSNADYTNAQLWSKIGMQQASWTTEPTGGPTIACSARDMARFGLMVMAGGTWDGTPLLTDATYLRAMTSPSQSLNPSYGYLWWLNGQASYVPPGAAATPAPGALVPNAPADLVAALGAADKKIYVVRSKDLVVVRHGGQSNASGSLALSAFDNEIWKRLSLAIR